MRNSCNSAGIACGCPSLPGAAGSFSRRLPSGQRGKSGRFQVQVLQPHGDAGGLHAHGGRGGLQRAARLGVPAGGRGHVAGAERVVPQRRRRAGRRRHQDRPLRHRPAGPAPRVRADAVHLPDGLHPGPNPTVHPVQSPQNRFCVLTLDPETLPAIATTLIDVLFYSHSAPKEAAPGDPGPCSITFFAFSLIEGYISIVMDAETQKKFPSDLLLTSSSGELWRMVRIGGQPLGFDECGIVAQIAGPLAEADISAYYISTFNFDHALVPEDGIGSVIGLLQRRQEGLGS
ncbi:cytosolic arginine sensor for mTORC1 subunit 1 isoform X3 [Pipistrellus kuhlii]|uniref:cytosolic arginine sensor for mTORC1 subunit 1 isoform X3 n=1 Tax=Pipistrellus kuhlii TaxID=59472 RepID=UPI00174EDB11|nr:cytosolic arginine sensor for mTORC1 subunit 1 isoform X3 [Pipistrellus kuhlii]